MAFSPEIAMGHDIFDHTVGAAPTRKIRYDRQHTGGNQCFADETAETSQQRVFLHVPPPRLDDGALRPRFIGWGQILQLMAVLL